MNKLKIGIVGSGAIGLAYAAWIGNRGHIVSVWSPRGSSEVLRHEPLIASGAIEACLRVEVANSANDIATFADVILIAVPLNAHRTVMDALLPHLRSGQLVLVSSMGSLSSLYLFEAALAQGLHLAVASFGTTVLTARRKDPRQVNVMTRRGSVSVSCLPGAWLPRVLDICDALFGGSAFTPESNPLVSTLGNTNPITHVPLAIFNWTRIERGESWPQYYYMTPRVASVIEKLDGERMAIASAFGIRMRRIDQHFSQSFNVESQPLAEIAAELHRRRGGPPGPIDVRTRYLFEDVPFGLVFLMALADIAKVWAPTAEALVNMAAAISGENLAARNDLLAPLGLRSESVGGLLSRVTVGQTGEIAENVS